MRNQGSDRVFWSVAGVEEGASFAALKRSQAG